MAKTHAQEGIALLMPLIMITRAYEIRIAEPLH